MRRHSVRRVAPAKINLYLHVVGQRADGYHLLDSLVVFAELGDVLTAAPAEDLSLVIDGPFAGALADEADNLVLRAARALARASGVPARAALSLEKNIPVAAGMGGGSADAAAALYALSELWCLPPAAADLAALAAALGADVPVCLAGHSAFVGGVGERVEAAPPFPSIPAVLINPGRPLATETVFGALDSVTTGSARFVSPTGSVHALAGLLAERHNDLEAPALSLLPAVGDVLRALRSQTGCLLARMTGSGPTCFGLFDGAAAARSGARAIQAAEPDWWAVPTTLAGGGNRIEMDVVRLGSQ